MPSERYWTQMKILTELDERKVEIDLPFEDWNNEEKVDQFFKENITSYNQTNIFDSSEETVDPFFNETKIFVSAKDHYPSQPKSCAYHLPNGVGIIFDEKGEVSLSTDTEKELQERNKAANFALIENKDRIQARADHLAHELQAAQEKIVHEEEALSIAKEMAPKKPFPMWFHRFFNTTRLKGYQSGQDNIRANEERLNNAKNECVAKEASYQSFQKKIKEVAEKNGVETPNIGKTEKQAEVSTHIEVSKLDRELSGISEKFGFTWEFENVLKESLAELPKLAQGLQCSSVEEYKVVREQYLENLAPVITFAYMAGRRRALNNGNLEKNQPYSETEFKIRGKTQEEIKQKIKNDMVTRGVYSKLLATYLRDPSKINDLLSMDLTTLTTTYFEKNLKEPFDTFEASREHNKLEENFYSEPLLNEIVQTCKECGFPEGFDKALADSFKELPKLIHYKTQFNSEDEFYKGVNMFCEKLGPVLMFAHLAGRRMDMAGGKLALGQETSGSEEYLRNMGPENLKQGIIDATKNFIEIPGLSKKIFDYMKDPSSIKELFTMNVQDLKTKVYDTTLKRGVYDTKDVMSQMTELQKDTIKPEVVRACNNYGFPSSFTKVLEDSLNGLKDLSNDKPCKTKEELRARREQYIEKLGPIILFAHMAGRRRDKNHGNLATDQEISGTEKYFKGKSAEEAKAGISEAIGSMDNIAVYNYIQECIFDPSKIDELVSKSVNDLTTEFYYNNLKVNINIPTVFEKFRQAERNISLAINKEDAIESKKEIIEDTKTSKDVAKDSINESPDKVLNVKSYLSGIDFADNGHCKLYNAFETIVSVNQLPSKMMQAFTDGITYMEQAATNPKMDVNPTVYQKKCLEVLTCIALSKTFLQERVSNGNKLGPLEEAFNKNSVEHLKDASKDPKLVELSKDWAEYPKIFSSQFNKTTGELIKKMQDAKIDFKKLITPENKEIKKENAPTTQNVKPKEEKKENKEATNIKKNTGKSAGF